MGCNCGAGAQCGCVIRAGSGITVSGIGTIADPWVLSSPVDCDAAMGCVGGRLAGGLVYNNANGTIAVCYSSTSDNMARAGVDGCVYVPPQLAGNGLDYNSSTRVLSVEYSKDGGNASRAGTDGGVFTPVPGGGTIAMVTSDSATVDLTGDGRTGTPLSAAVTAVPSGVAPVAVADTTTIDLSGDGTTGTPLSAAVKTGSYPIVTGDTATVDLAGNGTTGAPLTATVISVPAGALAIKANDTPSVDMTGDGTTGTPLTAAVRYSGQAGNVAQPGSDGGVYVPAPGGTGSTAILTADTTTIDMSGDGTMASPLSATVKPVAGTYPVAIADTTTIDLSGDGTTGAPLSGVVKTGSYPIVIGDTATVDLAGNGTTATPLTATVLTVPSGVAPIVVDNTGKNVTLAGVGTNASKLSGTVADGAVGVVLGVATSTAGMTGTGKTGAGLQVNVTAAPTGSTAVAIGNTSGEVTLSGDGKTGTPLKAELTGTYNGIWTNNGNVYVSGGNVYVNNPATATSYQYVNLLVVGADTFRTNTFVASDGGVRIDLLKNNVFFGRYDLGGDGEISITSGGQTRPLPFAMWTGNADMHPSNAVAYTAVINFPTGRFTQPPFVHATSQAYADWAVCAKSTTVSGTSIEVNEIHNAPKNANWVVAVTAIQMTALATEGRAARVENLFPPNMTSICHTPECVNEGIAIPGYAGDVTQTSITCGGCFLPVTDASPL